VLSCSSALRLRKRSKPFAVSVSGVASEEVDFIRSTTAEKRFERPDSFSSTFFPIVFYSLCILFFCSHVQDMSVRFDSPDFRHVFHARKTHEVIPFRSDKAAKGKSGGTPKSARIYGDVM